MFDVFKKIGYKPVEDQMVKSLLYYVLSKCFLMQLSVVSVDLIVLMRL